VVKLLLMGGLLSWVVFSMISCRALLPYEKEYLLSPLMEDEKLAPWQSGFTSVGFSRIERLSSQSGTGMTGSCPTCGG